MEIIHSINSFGLSGTLTIFENVGDKGFEDVSGDLAAHTHWTGYFPKDKGVSLATDTAIFLAGKQSLQLSLPQSPSSARVSSAPIPVRAGRSCFSASPFRVHSAGATSWALAWSHRVVLISSAAPFPSRAALPSRVRPEGRL